MSESKNIKYVFNHRTLSYDKYPEKKGFRQVYQIVISLIGLFAGTIGIYAFFFQEKKVSIEYEILSNTNVLDINADITKLDITYGGTSLKSNNENLRVINIRIRNNGNESILKDYYDEHDPLGLTIGNGRIIERPELINTSSEYLKKNVKINFDSSGKITFNEVILEPDQYFTIKLLVLHPTNQIPGIISFGKIAGQNNIPLISLVQQQKDQKSFWMDTFSGNVIIQITRALCYSIVVLLIGLGIFLAKSSISDYRAKRRRIKIVRDFKNIGGYEYNKMDDAIFSRFIELEYNSLDEFQELIKDENVLNIKYRKWIENLKKEYSGNIAEWDNFNTMLNDGYVIKDKGNIVINQPMKKTLTQFIDYLNKIGYKSPFWNLFRRVPSYNTEI